MHSLGIVQWNSTRWDHPRNPGGVSGSGPVTGYALVSSNHSYSIYSWKFDNHVIGGGDDPYGIERRLT